MGGPLTGSVSTQLPDPHGDSCGGYEGTRQRHTPDRLVEGGLQLQRFDAAPARDKDTTVQPILQHELPSHRCDESKGSHHPQVQTALESTVCWDLAKSAPSPLGRHRPSMKTSSAAPLRGQHEVRCSADMLPVRMRTPPWTRSLVLKNTATRHLLKMRRARAAKPAAPHKPTPRQRREGPKNMEAVLGHAQDPSTAETWRREDEMTFQGIHENVLNLEPLGS